MAEILSRLPGHFRWTSQSMQNEQATWAHNLSTQLDSLDPKDMDLEELVPEAETLAQREKIQYSTQLTLGSELPTINPHKIYYHRSWQGIQP